MVTQACCHTRSKPTDGRDRWSRPFAGECKMDQWLRVNSGDFRRLRLRLIFQTQSWQRWACQMHDNRQARKWRLAYTGYTRKQSFGCIGYMRDCLLWGVFKCQSLRVIKVYVWFHSQGEFWCSIICLGMWSISTRKVGSFKSVYRYLSVLLYFPLSFCFSPLQVSSKFHWFYFSLYGCISSPL